VWSLRHAAPLHQRCFVTLCPPLPPPHFVTLRHRYIKEDLGRARPGDPSLSKGKKPLPNPNRFPVPNSLICCAGEYRHAVNAFDKCHPYFLPKAAGDLRLLLLQLRGIVTVKR